MEFTDLFITETSQGTFNLPTVKHANMLVVDM